jgi:cobyrinic acid a,c-diamide synthase
LAFDEVSLPRLVLAGSGSGTGKTTVVAGILAALRARGQRAVPFKVGPDFADSTMLAHVAGAACRALDPWILGRDALLQSLHRGCQEADIAIVEGMLGLFDSWGAGIDASTAELSKLIQAPVVLVLDVAGTAQSAAAVALGFKSVDPGVRIAGVILNRVQSNEQGRWIEEAVWRLASVPVLGMLPELPELSPRDTALAGGSTSLADSAGLRAGGVFLSVEDAPLGEPGAPASLAAEAAIPVGGSDVARGLPPTEAFARRVDAIRHAVERHVDVDVLLRIAARAQPLRLIPRPEPLPRLSAPVRLGVAYDEAFNLYYPENLELLTEAGAEIVVFSPLEDHALPRVDALYIAGAPSDGHAWALSENARMRESLREAALDGLPVHAECGGLAYLGERLRPPARDPGAAPEEPLPMVGLIPIDVEVNTRTLTMGYRRLRTLPDTLVAPAGTILRGHEFHWTEISRSGATSPAFELADPDGYRSGHEGFARPGLLASNIHLHFGQRPAMALRLLEAAALHAHPVVV